MPTIIVEAALSIAVVAIASSALSYAFSAAAHPYGVMLSSDNEIYDIFSALLYDHTYSSCLIALNDTCMTSMLQEFNTFYHTSYASLSYRGRTFSYGAAAACTSSKTFCLPLKYRAEVNMSCMTLCG